MKKNQQNVSALLTMQRPWGGNASRWSLKKIATELKSFHGFNHGKVEMYFQTQIQLFKKKPFQLLISRPHFFPSSQTLFLGSENYDHDKKYSVTKRLLQIQQVLWARGDSRERKVMAKSLYPGRLHNSFRNVLAADVYITCPAPASSQSSSGRNTMAIIVPITAAILLNWKGTVKSWG